MTEIKKKLQNFFKCGNFVAKRDKTFVTIENAF